VRVSKAQAATNRERIIAEAARLFRQGGFDGISIADVTKSAGLTHGGFYGHFDSKEELMAEACQRAVGSMLEDWRAVTQKSKDPLAAITKPYLSMRHRDDAGAGCLMAALGPEVSRQAAPVRNVVTDCLRSVLDALAHLTVGKTAAQRRKEAIVTFATLVGALVVARAINDPTLAEEILQVTTASLSKAKV
jgi:TetR/AcrR family transcriptional regulator, transcriptional repressor for nem operon